MIGAELTALREKKRWTKAKLGREAGLAYPSQRINAYEAGRRSITPSLAILFTLLLTTDAQAPPAPAAPQG